MVKGRCKLIYAFVGCFLLSGWLNPAIAESVMEVTDLRAEGHDSERRQLPILLAMTASYCSYCEQLEEDFLEPMLISGDYRHRVIIRKLQIDSLRPIRDFAGNKTTPEALALRYGVSFTPTILFLDGQGRELTERMEGLTTPDFFGGYLDMAIDDARSKLPAMAPEAF